MKRQPSEGKKRGGGTPCCTKVGLKRGPWTPEEDELLASYVKREGAGKWRTLPKRAGLLRCGKSCRLRWMNYLRPTVKRGQIGLDEEDLILRLHRLLGNRWSLIAGRIPGRTDNEIKNYWNTHISKKLVSQGIDPRTHRPLSTSNQYNTPSTTTTTINIIDNALLTTPNHTPNPSPFEAHETNLIATKEIVHANNQLDHMLFHGSVTDYYLDGDGSNEGLGVDCFPDDMFSSYINSFVDEDILQEKKEVNDNINNNNYGCGGNGCNNGGDDNVMAPAEPLASPLSAFGDENFWENVVSSAEDADQFMDFSDHFNKFS